MPGGRARGNPAQIFSENSQKFPSTDLKNILYFDISMYPSYIWHMNFGQSPLGLDFGVFGPLWIPEFTQCSKLNFSAKMPFPFLREANLLGKWDGFTNYSNSRT